MRFRPVRFAVGIVLVAICAPLGGCGDILGGLDALVGEYAVKQGGPAELKVTKGDGKYYAAIREGGDWSSPEEIVPCKDEDYAQVFGPGWKEAQPIGLRGTNGPFGIFKVRKGSKVGDHIFQTGFFLFFLGGGDVYKL